MTLALAISLVGYLVTSLFLHMAFARFFWLLVGVSMATPTLARRVETEAAREVATR